MFLALQGESWCAIINMLSWQVISFPPIPKLTFKLLKLHPPLPKYSVEKKVMCLVDSLVLHFHISNPFDKIISISITMLMFYCDNDFNCIIICHRWVWSHVRPAPSMSLFFSYVLVEKHIESFYWTYYFFKRLTA